MTYAVPLKVTIRLVVWNKDPGDRRQDHPRHQGAGGLLRRHPADDGQRHVHHQRHRARHRLAAPPLAGRVLPLGRQDPLHRADHPVSRIVGRVRVRREEPALRAHRSQAQVPGDGVPARARPARRRRDHPHVPPGRSHPPEGQHAAAGRSATAWSACAPSATSRTATSRSARAARSPRRTSTGCARPASKTIEVADEALEGAYTASDIVDPATGEVLLEANEELTARVDLDGAGEERRARSRCSSPSATRSARSCRRR